MINPMFTEDFSLKPEYDRVSRGLTAVGTLMIRQLKINPDSLLLREGYIFENKICHISVLPPAIQAALATSTGRTGHCIPGQSADVWEAESGRKVGTITVPTANHTYAPTGERVWHPFAPEEGGMRVA